MKTITLVASLTLTLAAGAFAQGGAYPIDPARGRYPSPLDRGYGYAPQARIWVEQQRDYLRRGDRIRAAFSTSTDAYVAVIHIDPDGRLEFLYPVGPYDADFVAGGRTYPLPYRSGADRGLLVRSGAGIGYLYVIASPRPLDYAYFQGRAAGSWNWSPAGQMVRGDPFWALEQITRYLVPDWGYVPIGVDYYSYHVGGIQRYPSYACGGRAASFGTGWGWGWGGGYTPAYYDSCDRLDPYLRSNPYYFDALNYRGDRRSYFRQYGPNGPEHRFKEEPDARPGSGGSRSATPASGRVVPSTGSVRAGSAAPRAEEPARRPAVEPRAEPRAPARGVSAPSGAQPTRRAAPAEGGSGSARPTTNAEPARRPSPNAGS